MGGVDGAMMGRLAQRFATAIERPTLAYAASLSAVAAAAALLTYLRGDKARAVIQSYGYSF